VILNLHTGKGLDGEQVHRQALTPRLRFPSLHAKPSRTGLIGLAGIHRRKLSLALKGAKERRLI